MKSRCRRLVSILYRYRGTDPNHHENVGLRKAMRRSDSTHLSSWRREGFLCSSVPRVHRWRRSRDSYLYGRSRRACAGDRPGAVRRRPHRSPSLRDARSPPAAPPAGIPSACNGAYRESCAVCRLKQRDLLDAADIIPDRDPRSEPIVSSGISLCRLHHAAFDSDIVGIHPDYRIEIRADVLGEKDGPMLVHGLQGFHGAPLIVPRQKEHLPNKNFLAERYARFSKAS